MSTAVMVESEGCFTPGDKIKFIIKGVGVFIGYIKHYTTKAISMKGCRLLHIQDSAYKMQDVDVDYYKDQHTHTFLIREFGHIEIIEKAPF